MHCSTPPNWEWHFPSSFLPDFRLSGKDETVVTFKIFFFVLQILRVKSWKLTANWWEPSVIESTTKCNFDLTLLCQNYFRKLIWYLGWIPWTHLRSTQSSYAMRHTFTPKKASQELGVECKMASRPTFSLYEINPWYSQIQTDIDLKCSKIEV